MGGFEIMGRNEIFERVNELMETMEYPVEIKDISDIEDFLNEEDNQTLEEYEEIEKLYNDLLEGNDLEEE
jgi:hypothetical protein